MLLHLFQLKSRARMTRVLMMMILDLHHHLLKAQLLSVPRGKMCGSLLLRHPAPQSPSSVKSGCSPHLQEPTGPSVLTLRS
jgi:hypothetical protein